MKILRTIAVTFAQYSRIPMPHFDWKEDDMRYSMSVFPCVGAVIGLVCFAVYTLCCRFAVPATAAALLMSAVPVFLTGGFHIDGFMDVADALSSFGSREDKLRILKDPHIGAFSVIRLVLCGLVYVASEIIIADSGLRDGQSAAVNVLVITTSCGFVISRALSAIAVLNFKSAKREGMLYSEASAAGQGRRVNSVIDVLWILLASKMMLFTDLISGTLEIAAALCIFGWYRYLSYREFGGITGDTAGWFVTVCETAVMAAGALSALIMLMI